MITLFGLAKFILLTIPKGALNKILNTIIKMEIMKRYPIENWMIRILLHI